jgi:hypothetical protein
LESAGTKDASISKWRARCEKDAIDFGILRVEAQLCQQLRNLSPKFWTILLYIVTQNGHILKALESSTLSSKISPYPEPLKRGSPLPVSQLY